MWVAKSSVAPSFGREFDRAGPRRGMGEREVRIEYAQKLAILMYKFAVIVARLGFRMALPPGTVSKSSCL